MGWISIGGRTIQSDALTSRAAQVSSGLESLGIGPGDGVAICLRNDLPFFEATFGAGAIGAYLIAVNWHATPDEARYVLDDSGAKALVIHADLLRPIRHVIPAGVTVLVVKTPVEVQEAYGIADEDAAVVAGDTSWDAWADGFEAVQRPVTQPPSTIIYTSGTTGRPKGVRRPTATQQQADAAAAMLALSYGYTDYLSDPGSIVTAIVGPIYHAAPNAHAAFSARLGANVVIMPRFEPELLLQTIEAKRITHLNMVPIMFSRLLKLPDEIKSKYDLSSLRYVAHAAAPCPPAVKRGMIEWWGPVINEYYGSTEMGNVTHCTSEEWLAHPGTVGKPMPGAGLRVVDEAGNDMPVRGVGEVLGRTLGMNDFTYHGDDAKRRAAEKQGLISPGDIGYFDEDGFLYLCDRAKDIIISGGANIYSAEIEAELHKMPGVADCAVFGIPDEEFGEAVCAVVQPVDAGSLSESDVRNWLRERISGYKVPRRVDFSAALPREDSGKIFKRKLREPFWADAGRSI